MSEQLHELAVKLCDRLKCWDEGFTARMLDSEIRAYLAEKIAKAIQQKWDTGCTPALEPIFGLSTPPEPKNEERVRAAAEEMTALYDFALPDGTESLRESLVKKRMAIILRTCFPNEKERK